MKLPWRKPTLFQLPEKVDYSHALSGILRDVVNYPLQIALQYHDLQAIADHIGTAPRRLDHYRRAVGSQMIPLSKFLRLCDLANVQIILRGATHDLQVDPAHGNGTGNGNGVECPAILDDYDLKRIRGTIASAGDTITAQEAISLISHIIEQAR